MSKATTGDVFKVRERQLRALTYLPHGQPCATWLPPGLWKHDGDCTVSDASAYHTPAVILRRPAPMLQDGTWYVGAAAV